MTWLLRYRLRHLVSDSVWILPLLSLFAALGAVWLLHWIEEGLGLEAGLSTSAAQTVLGTMASSLFTFIVFVSSALLVAVQLASSQLSPRIIAVIFGNPFTRYSLVVFVFTFTFSLAALARVDTVVPPLTARLAAYGGAVSLGVFLFMIDRVGKALRPSGALQAVARRGREAIGRLYPRRSSEGPDPDPAPVPVPSEGPTRTIASRKDGMVLAFDVPGLVSLARQADCVIELVPQVGDFVALADPLYRILRGGARLSEEALHRSIALGQERDLAQDPAFALRIIVDIASKGLSPAINDPTTAVLALDQLHHLLRDLGSRRLDEGRVRDSAGELRLVYRAPGWEDYVRLALTEIRHYGGSSIQVARRLRALLEDLIRSLPGERLPPLCQELEKLRRSVERFFLDPEDLVLAGRGDLQGLGGEQGPTRGGHPGEEVPPT